MTQQRLTELFAEFTQQQAYILTKKNTDYANTDALSNFKSVACILNTTPELVTANLIGVKLARLGVLLNSDKSPVNESVLDSIMDLANYAFLLHCCVIDTHPQPTNV